MRCPAGLHPRHAESRIFLLSSVRPTLRPQNYTEQRCRTVGEGVLLTVFNVPALLCASMNPTPTHPLNPHPSSKPPPAGINLTPGRSIFTLTAASCFVKPAALRKNQHLKLFQVFPDSEFTAMSGSAAECRGNGRDPPFIEFSAALKASITVCDFSARLVPAERCSLLQTLFLRFDEGVLEALFSPPVRRGHR